MSASRNERGYGQGEEDKRRKNNSSNLDFVQKYSQSDYSRAIPTNVLPHTKPRLGEYCVPVDSKPLQKKLSMTLEDYNCDAEGGYAQPQDSLLTANMSNSRKMKKDEDADSDDEGEVYELAKQTPEDYHVPVQKKPSPKPRITSKVKEKPAHYESNKKPTSEPSNSFTSKDEDDSTSNAEYNLASAPIAYDSSRDQYLSERKRPPKKVVEIEYEVASEIRKSQPPPPSATPPLSYITQRSSVPAYTTQTTSSKDNVPGAKVIQTQSQTPSPNYPPPPSPKAFPNPSSHPPQFEQEGLYEEPWDLKAKRLKQEQEEKKSARRISDATKFLDKSPQVYEDAWDSPSRQKKLEEKLFLARTFSTASEGGEVYHDAVEDMAGHKADSYPDASPQRKPAPTNLQLAPQQPQDMYEDAWDLKNKILEERLSKMHLQATQSSQATYEEPWDNSRQQKELQEKLHRTRQAAGERPVRVGPNLSGPIIRSTSDARDHISPDAQEAKSNFISRGRHHSIDASSLKTNKSRNLVVGQRINPSIPLINQSWFHGNITRDDAEQMLCVCKEGSYIVRISSDRKSYSLSIKSAKQNIHVQIEQSAQMDGSLRYILGKNSKEFTTIPEMIDYYTQHRVPLRGAEHITLLHPVECKWSQQS